MIAGRYSLDREIGRGGSGVVWLGRDEVLGRQVALKRIGMLPGANRTDVARAEREARLSAQLNHPHVVAVFDVVTDSDAVWLVMEYVDGVTLGQLVQQQGALSPDEAAPLLRQATDALLAAHAAGIAHRDVKPSNILLDRNHRVKLTDFGIARITSDATLTHTGMLTGSPAYLAPEVATGGRGDEAADVWSLGATMFHLLAGRPPYDVGDNVLATLYRIVHEEPPLLDHAGWMAPLLEGTMVRDPSRRWTLAQVRDFLAGSHPTPGPVPPLSTATPAPHDDETGTQVLGAVPPPAPTPVPEPTPAPTTSIGPPPAPAEPVPPAARRPPRRAWLLGAAALAVLLLVVVLVVSLSGRDSPSGTTAAPTDGTSSKAPAKPTAAGMEAFIRDYVSTVAEDPDRAWPMLTPKFQRESGGLDTYRGFWDSATNGRVLSISANPDNLTVSYQVHFDNFDNGPGPTVLDLRFDGGRYRIDGEHSKGFVPAG